MEPENGTVTLLMGLVARIFGWNGTTDALGKRDCPVRFALPVRFAPFGLLGRSFGTSRSYYYFSVLWDRH
jgi:hypothetical protein